MGIMSICWLRFSSQHLVATPPGFRDSEAVIHPEDREPTKRMFRKSHPQR